MCIYFYLLQLFGKLTILSLHNIYLIALFFLQFILSDIAVSPALFRMGCLFPSFHFSPFHVLRFVSTTCFNSLTNSVSLALCFTSSYFFYSRVLMCILWWWKTGTLDSSFHATVISEGMYWMFPSYHDVSSDSLG